jgi:hypothetical protein
MGLRATTLKVVLELPSHINSALILYACLGRPCRAVLALTPRLTKSPRRVIHLYVDDPQNCTFLRFVLEYESVRRWIIQVCKRCRQPGHDNHTCKNDAS